MARPKKSTSTTVTVDREKNRWRAQWREGNRRPARSFSISRYGSLTAAERAARAFAAAKEAELRGDTEAPLPPDAKAALAALARACRETHTSLPTALEDAARRVRANVGTADDLPLEHVIDRFLLWYRKERQVRDVTWRNVDGHLQRLLAAFPEATIRDFEAGQLADYITARYTAAKSRADCRAALNLLFAWAADERLIPANPIGAVKLPRQLADKRTVSFLRPEQTTALFRALRPDLRAGLALAVFAGLRPEDLVPKHKKTRLLWRHIDLDRRILHIPAEVDKLRTPHWLEHLPDNLWAWLERYRQSNAECPVVRLQHKAHRQQLTAAAEKAGTPLSHDILRHTFGTHAYHHVGYERTLELMRHTSAGSTFFRHYKGMGNPAMAAEHFAITPDICAAAREERRWSLTAPDGQIHRPKNLRLWVEENPELFPGRAATATMANGQNKIARALARLHPSARSRAAQWQGWTWAATASTEPEPQRASP